MATRRVSKTYSRALCERIVERVVTGEWTMQACPAEGVQPRAFRYWCKKHDWLAEAYGAAKYTRMVGFLEANAIRIADPSRDIGRSASHIVQRDKALCDYGLRLAALLMPKDFGAKLNLEHSGVTEKRVVIVEKFDGARIKRFTRS